MKPTLSACLATYNYGRYLNESVEAIVSQSMPADEIVVVDDCSTDDTRNVMSELCRRFPQIKYYRNPENIGTLSTVERMIELSSGSYMALLGADDPIDLTYFEKLFALARRYPQAGIICSDYRAIDVEGNKTPVRFSTILGKGYITPSAVIDAYRNSPVTMAVPTNSTIWKRSTWFEAGGIIRSMRWHFDWFVALVIAVRYGIAYVPEELQTVRWVEGSYSGNRTNPVLQKEVAQAIYQTLLEDQYADVRDVFGIPAVSSMLGLSGIDVLLSEDRFSGFLSLELVKATLAANGVNIDPPIWSQFCSQVTKFACEQLLRDARPK